MKYVPLGTLCSGEEKRFLNQNNDFHYGRGRRGRFVYNTCQICGRTYPKTHGNPDYCEKCLRVYATHLADIADQKPQTQDVEQRVKEARDDLLKRVFS